MKQYPRVTALIVLAVSSAAGYSYLKLNRPETSDSSVYEDKIAAQTADIEDWKNYVRALAKEGKYDRLPTAFRKVMSEDPSDRSIKFIYIEALGRQSAQNTDARTKLLDFLDSHVQTDPKLVLDSFERPEIAPLKSIPEFDALYKTAQRNAAD